MLRLVSAVLSAVLMANCGGSSPTSATSPTAAFVGTWAEPVGWSSRLQITLTDSPVAQLTFGPDTVTGTWTFTASDSTQNRSGTCTGRVAETTIALVLRLVPPVPGACDEN